MNPKHKVLMSKKELVARFKARQEKKFGGSENLKKHIEEGRKRISDHMAKTKVLGNNPNEKYKSDYQKKVGRAYSE